MVFSSIEFLWLFMPVVLVLYALVHARAGATRCWPPSASSSTPGAPTRWCFCSWAASSSTTWPGGRSAALSTPGARCSRAGFMWAAVVVDLLVLFTWKYAVFGAHQLNDLLGVFGEDRIGVPSILLPHRHFVLHVPRDQLRGGRHPRRRNAECDAMTDYAQYMAYSSR